MFFYTTVFFFGSAPLPFRNKGFDAQLSRASFPTSLDDVVSIG